MPYALINFAGRMTLYISDPAAIQDIFVTKNSLYDKTGAFQGAMKHLFGNAFIFAKTDETWKTKRKASAHAFYKDRLVHMLDVFKDNVMQVSARWMAEIEASSAK